MGLGEMILAGKIIYVRKCETGQSEEKWMEE